MSNIISRIFDVLILITCIVGIGIFLTMDYYAILFWRTTYATTIGVQAQMFWVALLVAILYSSMQFIVLFINSFGETIKRFNKK